MHSQEPPLIQIGPNNSYGTAYYSDISFNNGKKKARLIAVVGGSRSDYKPATYQAKPKTLVDRLFGIDRVDFSPAASASNTWDFSKEVKNYLPTPSTRIQLISMYLKNMTKFGHKFVTQLPLFSRSTLNQEQPNEPNSKTTRSSRTHQEASKR
ncbi:hypothetical protein H8D29_06905, partial [PVC group bacterium]|nr:hypothetical protein [PVC group bacterium]